MLETLYIKNFAIIDELEVNFYSGLNVLSGETGAGKSIIIGSVNFVLGGKADREIIKTGEDFCEVSMVISVNDEKTINSLLELDIDVEDDNSLLIKRTFNNQGKSACRINGKPVTVSMIKQVASLLFDIHSQHDNHKLLNSKNHIDILDNLCPEIFVSKKESLSELYLEYKKLNKEIKELDFNDGDNKDKIELYEYQINEIEKANLKLDEEEELDNRRHILVNSVKLKNCSDNILDLLYRNENSAVIDNLSEAINELSVIENIDSSVLDILSELESAYTIIEDCVTSVRDYSDNIDCDENELEEIENRITLIYELKKKYGNSIELIFKYLENTKEKLNKIINSEELVAEYKKNLKDITNKINVICDEISAIRTNTAHYIGKKIQNTLYDLSMESAKFEIKVEKTDEFSSKGADFVEFLISANKGEPMKPLSKVASGGEMSRVMLALKTVLADTDNIDTFIFDEIDTGISGRTAQKVAEKLQLIAKNHQILCITHLPQIAAMADKNYLIEKSSDDNKTLTNITELNGNSVYEELARLIGGTVITEATIMAAKEMKEMADKLKEKKI
ncbi:MAG: DNA repair protein RecN [Lachnospirales bacterium]